MEKPCKPEQSDYLKVGSEQKLNVHDYYGTGRIKLEHNRYNFIVVKKDYYHYDIVLKEMIPDEDAYKNAMIKYEENMKKYYEYRKSVIPDEIKKIEEEIEKLRRA